MKTKIKDFSHEIDAKYDLETYYGRFKHFQSIIHPKNLLYTDSTLKNYAEILKKHRENVLEEKISNEKLWEMKYGYSCEKKLECKFFFSFD